MAETARTATTANRPQIARTRTATASARVPTTASFGTIPGMSCPTCDLTEELERHARVIAQELADAREAKLLVLTPEQQEAVRRDEEFLALLLDRIEQRRYPVA